MALKMRVEDPHEDERVTEVKLTAAKLIPALHEAKEELSKELEANLNQLKSVIQESNRIAKSLEAVLAEIQASSAQDQAQQAKQTPPDQKEASQGTRDGMSPEQMKGQEGKAKQESEGADQSEKEQQGGGKGNAPPETMHGQAAGKQKEDNPRQSEGKVPQWQPPEGN